MKSNQKALEMCWKDKLQKNRSIFGLKNRRQVPSFFPSKHIFGWFWLNIYTQIANMKRR